MKSKKFIAKMAKAGFTCEKEKAENIENNKVDTYFVFIHSGRDLPFFFIHKDTVKKIGKIKTKGKTKNEILNVLQNYKNLFGEDEY